jgi:hypothetical protein
MAVSVNLQSYFGLVPDILVSLPVGRNVRWAV